MSLLGWLFGGNDHELAATRYEGRESATDRAARKRQQRYSHGGATRAARKGQSWEDADRDRETGRRTRKPGR